MWTTDCDKSKKHSAYKEHLSREIKYYEKRIEEFHANKNQTLYYDDAYSSESDNELTLALDAEPISKLKEQESQLNTRHQAIEELASLQVIQSEVNIMVTSPEYVREAPITEEGTWKEVIAECRVDFIPFTISFYVFEPNRTFAPTLYRGLRVQAVKKSHELELEKSVLPMTTCLSWAIEILKSYAAASRSRRATLAHLARQYGEALFMEPLPTGGYMLKCANLMKMTWVLQNGRTYMTPFLHKMEFDLEYMEESYVRTISQTNDLLSNPLIDTNKRTLLLSKIIATCLEAQGSTQELHENVESDQETAQKLSKRRTNLDHETEEPIMETREEEVNNERESRGINENKTVKAKNVIRNKNSNKNATVNNKTSEKNKENNKKENEVMAPPKLLPKRKKPAVQKIKRFDNPKILKRLNRD